MPKKQKKTAAAAVASDHLTLEDIKSIWTSLRIDSWLDFLDMQPGNWYQKGNEIWGQCPYHDDNTASFHIRPFHGYAKCFGSCGTFENDPVALISKISKKPYLDLIVLLQHKYNITGLSSSVIAGITALQKREKVKRYIQIIFNRELCDAINNPIDPAFDYTRDTVTLLRSRNIPLDMISQLPLGVVPTPQRLWVQLDNLKTLLGDAYYEGLKEDIQVYLNLIPRSIVEPGAYAGWLSFCNHISPGHIGLFRFRCPRNNPDGSKSFVALEEMENGAKVHTPMGFFGLGAGFYRDLIGRDDVEASKKVYVVEGEFDVLAALIPQLASSPSAIVIAAGGNNNHNLDSLSNLGFEEVVILGDRDAGGESFIRSHLKETRELKCRVFKWPPCLQLGIKNDLHDAYMAVGGNMVVSELINPDNIVFPQKWVLQLVEQETRAISKDDVRSRIDIAISYGKILNDEGEKEAYSDEVGNILHIPTDSIRSRLTASNSEEAFIQKLIDLLDKEFRILYKENTKNGTVFITWHKKSRVIVTLDTSSVVNLSSVLQGLFCSSLVDFVEKSVGPAPQFNQTEMKEKTIQISIIHRHQYYANLLAQIIIPNLLPPNLPRKKDLTVLNSGIHIKDIDDSYVVYIVNGPYFFKGIPHGDNIVWEEPDGPIDDTYFADVKNAERWSTAFESIEDLNSTPKVDGVSLYSKLVHILGSGWRFIYHDLEIKYLAAAVLSLPLSDTTKNPPWIFFNADRGSGKSTLILNALSPNLKNPICIFEHGFGVTGVTLAGIKQKLQNSTLTLILDEFEFPTSNSDKDKHKAANEELMSLLRSAYSHGVSHTQGTTSGDGQTYKLRLPVIGAAINLLRGDANIDRFNTIGLPRLENGPIGSTPERIILRSYTVEQLKEIRHSTTLFALQNVTAYRRTVQKIANELDTGMYLAAGTSPRFKESLVPVLAIMDMIGENYKDFSLVYSNTKSAYINDKYEAVPSDTIWAAIMHSSTINLPREEYFGKTFTLGELLSDATKAPLVNESGTGIYYHHKSKNLFFVWRSVAPHVLRFTNFRSLKPSDLKNKLKNDSRILKDEVVQADPELMQFLSNLGIMKSKEVTVISATHFTNNIYETTGTPFIENTTNTAADTTNSILDLPAGNKHNI